MLFLW